MSNFLRTQAGSFATSLVQTRWANATRENQTELAGAMHQGQSTLDGMIAGGASPESARVMLTNIVEGQSVMLATLNTFAAIVMCRSEGHTSELQSLMRHSYAGLCLKKKRQMNKTHKTSIHSQ